MTMEKYDYGPPYVLYTGIDPEIRKRRNWTLDDVLNRCYKKISKKTLISYEKGRTDASASNLMMLSYALGTSIDALLKRTNTVHLAFETGYIKRFTFDSNGQYSLNKDNPTYYLDHNLKISKELGAVELASDSIVLGIPKGTILITDQSKEAFKTIDETGKKVLIEEGRVVYPSTIKYTPSSRNKNMYTYLDQNSFPVHIQQKDLFSTVLGVIIKAIIEY